MCPELFSIGNISVKGYGTMMALGILVAIVITLFRGEKKGFSKDAVIDIAIYGVLGGLLGAKLLYILVEMPNITRGMVGIKDIIFNGFVIYGAIIGGVGAALIYCKVKKLNFIILFDLVVPALAIAQGIGRIGCLLAGCCYGAETTSKLYIVFPEKSFAPSGVHLYPTQIYSSIGDFIIATILFIFYAKKKNRKDGQTALLYVMLYSIGRFFLEFLRADERGNVGALSTSQFISLILLIICFIVFIVSCKRKAQMSTGAISQEATLHMDAEDDERVIFDINSVESSGENNSCDEAEKKPEEGNAESK